MFNPQGLLLLLTLGAAVAGWQTLSRLRERALASAKTLCAELPAQCLDESVVLIRLRPKALFRGEQRLECRYAFEFSLAGHDRHRGELMLSRGRVMWARLEHPEGTLHLDGAGSTLRRVPSPTTSPTIDDFPRLH